MHLVGQVVQEVLLLLSDGLGQHQGEGLHPRQYRVQLLLQRGDPMVQVLAAPLELRHQVVHHVLGLEEGDQRRYQVRHRVLGLEEGDQRRYQVRHRVLGLEEGDQRRYQVRHHAMGLGRGETGWSYPRDRET